MVNGISGSAASYITANTQTAPIQRTQTFTASQGTTAANSTMTDSVQLSAAAQAHTMQQQGMAVKTIAANMGTTTRTVDSYLNISSTITAGGSRGPSEVAKIAAHVRVNPPASGIES